MTTQGGWAPSGLSARYGAQLGPGQPTPGQTELRAVRGPAAGDDLPSFHPNGPLFWFGVIAAAAVGLMYASTTVRVGPVSASVSAGKK
jgi:hypothetical protein